MATGTNSAGVMDALHKGEKTVDAVFTFTAIYFMWVHAEGHPGWGVLSFFPDLLFALGVGWYFWKYVRAHKFFD